MNANKGKRSPAMNVALHLWSAYKHVLLWYWIIFTGIYVTINELFMRCVIPNDEVRESGSIWAGASISPRIFLLVLGILLTVGSFSSFVSNGLTRRSFVKGSLLFMAVMSLICAAINLIGFPVERYIVDMSGAARTLDHPDLAVEGLTTLLVFFGYFCGGWLIGSGFYRFHWVKGLLVCWLSVAFMLALDYITGLELLASGAANTAINLILLLVLCAALIWLNHSFLRKAAVKRKMTM
ncbi:hypothetical protein RB620_11475 [Paenibacillus sp. LHD-117]|uniref:hypothetical protein n=1 Tax=Paenibacillus sp. LHD-117 TaxID=3071412 RepID=UPI0027E02DBC|nr:hypothetical protein [Paenibacillus sp. LHD-117]MDQ6420056.1 hypothetical protein [Paenibacillus sp. LHD-117]